MNHPTLWGQSIAATGHRSGRGAECPLPVTAGRFRSSLVPIAGRRCACPAYISAQVECRPGKAQPPPGIEAGEALDAHCRWPPNGSLYLLCPLPGGAAFARPTGACRENVGPVRRSRHRALKREWRRMPIVGGCRTVPFISCACCRAALRLPGLHQRAGRM